MKIEEMPRKNFIALYLWLNGSTRRKDIEAAYKTIFNTTSTSVYFLPQQVSEMGLWEKDPSKSKTVEKDGMGWDYDFRLASISS